MATYRKKPVDVEMIRWEPEWTPIQARDELLAWADGLCERNENVRTLQIGLAATDDALRFWVNKGASESTIMVGDWIAAEGDADGYYPLTRDAQAAGYTGPRSADFELAAAGILNERLHELLTTDVACETACTHLIVGEWTALGAANVLARHSSPGWAG